MWLMYTEKEHRVYKGGGRSPWTWGQEEGKGGTREEDPWAEFQRMGRRLLVAREVYVAA